MRDPAASVTPKIATGIPGMDELLHGGLTTGSLYIVEGVPGAGKTIFANQLCFAAAARGETAVYVTLLAETHDRMLRHMESLSFFRREDVHRQVIYTSAFDALATSGLNAVLRLITTAARQHRSRVLVLDGVFLLGTGADQDAEFRVFLNSVAALAHMLDMIVVMLTSPTRKPRMPERTMVDGWIELQHRHQDFRSYREVEVRKYRGSGFVGGRHTMDITEDGIRVWPRLEVARGRGAEPEVSSRKVTTGVPGLDHLFHGGVHDRSTTLVHGPMGIGKTTLGLTFVTADDEPALMVGFQERVGALRARCAALGLPIAPRLDAGTLELLWMQPADILLDEFAYRILEVVAQRGARRLFVDRVDLLAQSVLHPRRIGPYFHALSAELRAMGVTTLVSTRSAERTGLEALMFDALASAASNVVGLHFTSIDGRPRHAVQLGKVRDAPFDPHAYEFRIGAGGMIVGDELPPDVARQVLRGEHG